MSFSTTSETATKTTARDGFAAETGLQSGSETHTEGNLAAGRQAALASGDDGASVGGDPETGLTTGASIDATTDGQAGADAASATEDDASAAGIADASDATAETQDEAAAEAGADLDLAADDGADTGTSPDAGLPDGEDGDAANGLGVSLSALIADFLASANGSEHGQGSGQSVSDGDDPFLVIPFQEPYVVTDEQNLSQIGDAFSSATADGQEGAVALLGVVVQPLDGTSAGSMDGTS